MILLILLGLNVFAEPTLTQVPKVTSKKIIAPRAKALNTQQIRIGIIDTGYNGKWTKAPLKLCADGHYNHMNGKSEVASAGPHGTIVGSIIAEELESAGVNYCAVIFQVVGPKGLHVEGIIEALRRINTQGLQAVNISLKGPVWSFYEKEALKRIARKGTALFIAAGNDRKDLDKTCNSVPACYSLPNTFVVGAMTEDMQFIAPYSNYGRQVTVWMPGDYSIRGRTFEGTSFATPRALAMYVYGLALLMSGK